MDAHRYHWQSNHSSVAIKVCLTHCQCIHCSTASGGVSRVPLQKGIHRKQAKTQVNAQSQFAEFLKQTWCHNWHANCSLGYWRRMTTSKRIFFFFDRRISGLELQSVLEISTLRRHCFYLHTRPKTMPTIKKRFQQWLVSLRWVTS